jgi:HKD family nuclease
MAIDIYKGVNINIKSYPIESINLSSSILNKLNEYNVRIDEYGKSIFQVEQISAIESFLISSNVTGTDFLELNKLIKIVKKEKILTLIGD